MKRIMSRLLAGILAAGLLLSGCGRDGQPSGAEPGAPRGRYVETELRMPEDLNYAITTEQMADGSIRIFGLKGTGELGPEITRFYRVWSSSDSGDTWTEEDMPWYKEIDELSGDGGDVSFDQAAFISPDELYLGSVKWVPNAPEAPAEEPAEEEASAEATGEGEEAPAGEESGDELRVLTFGAEGAGEETADGGASDEGEEEEGSQNFFTDGAIVSSLYRAGKDGLTDLGHSLLSEIGDGGSTTTPNVMRLEGGDLLLSYYGYIKRMDAATGEEILRYPTGDDLMNGSFAAAEDRLIAAMQSGFLVFNLPAGDKLDDLPLTNLEVEEGSIAYSGNPANMTAITLTEDQSAVFYLNATGLYRMPLDGSVTEKLMDGALTSVGMPSVYVTHLFRCADESFLVFASGGRDGGPLLFRYSFDPAIPSVPANELGVYSLRENQTIRQAIGQMQQGDADVKVNYRVGMGDQNAVTAADALRTLSTEMLAGNGPDVIVLDGIPVDSYIEKGALADISALLGERITSGGLIPGVAESFRREGKLYAIPARFSVPMLHGAGIGPITDFDSLKSWVGKDGRLLDVGADLILGHFYDMLSPRWFREDGSLNEERFAADLEFLSQNVNDFPGINHLADFSGGAVALKGGLIPLNLSYVKSLIDVAGPCSLIEESGEGEVKLFPEGGMFIPGTVLGVNAASSQEELAGRFIETVLSEEVQTQDFQDGLPVNDKALAAQSANKSQFTRAFGTSAIDDETGEYITIFLEIKEPSDEFMNSTLESFRGLTGPSFPDSVVKDMVLEAGTPCMTGERTIGEAVAVLKAKLDLYLAE